MARILIIANALHSGGAEQTIATLAMDLNRDHDVRIYVIREYGPVGEELSRNGMAVAPGPRKSNRTMANIAMLPIYMSRFRPQYVISFLYVSDVVGGICGRLFVPHAKIVWNIRKNLLRSGQIGRVGLVALKLACRLARVVPHLIVYCSTNAGA